MSNFLMKLAWVLCALVALSNLETMISVAQSQSWSRTEGTIIYHGPKFPNNPNSNRGTNPYIIRYRILVEGKSFESTSAYPERIGLFRGGEFGDSFKFQTVASDKIVVYYDPHNPSRSALDRSYPGLNSWYLFYLFLAAVWINNRYSSRKLEEDS